MHLSRKQAIRSAHNELDLKLAPEPSNTEGLEVMARRLKDTQLQHLRLEVTGGECFGAV